MSVSLSWQPSLAPPQGTSSKLRGSKRPSFTNGSNVRVSKDPSGFQKGNPYRKEPEDTETGCHLSEGKAPSPKVRDEIRE